MLTGKCFGNYYVITVLLRSTLPLYKKPMTTAAAESSTTESSQNLWICSPEYARVVSVVAFSVPAGHRLENETDYRETSRGMAYSWPRRSRLLLMISLCSHKKITKACNTSLHDWQRSLRRRALGSANRRQRGWGLTPQMQTTYNWMKW